MCDEGTPKSSRRSARLSPCGSPDQKPPPPPPTTTTKASKLQALSIEDLVFHGEPLSLDGLIASFPGRRSQIMELINLLGPLDSPMMPLFVYGGASTGKTSVMLQIFRYLKRPFVYCSLITCYSPRILFESVLNQLLLHRACESSRYASAKRCERPSDFANLLREALSNLVNTLKGNVEKSGSMKPDTSTVNGKMIYLIFDNVEVAREWDMSSSMVPFFFNLPQILSMPEVGLIFISRASLITFKSDTGYVEPLQVYFPDYNEGDLRSIFMRDRAKSKLYQAFLDLVLPPFYRITRRVDELSAVFTPLFKKYCEPLDDLGTALNEEVKRKLFSHIQPYITMYLQTTFFSSSQHLPNDAPGMKNETMKKKTAAKAASEEIGFHMSTSARYLLISAFLASRNPATLDASLFDSTGGLDNRKRKRKVSEKSMEKKETKELELLMKGPGTFPLERLLAIYQCIASVGDYAPEYGNSDSMEAESCNNASMPNIFLQLSSLCSANFISKGGSCPLEGSTRYRSAISEDMALKVARSLDFPLSKYLYRS